MASSKSSAGEKTEKPTPKRRREGRKDGQIAKSTDLVAWVGVLAASYLLETTVTLGFTHLQATLQEIGDLVAEPSVTGLSSFLGATVAKAGLIVAPLLGALVAIGVVGNVGQVGWAPTAKKIKPDLKKLNLAKGLKQLFSAQIVWEGAKTLLKAGVVLLVAYPAIRDLYVVAVTSGSPSVPAVAGQIARAALSFIRVVALLGIVIGAFDWLMAKRRVDKQLKMTKQEVKEELKQTEGDPLVKGQIRQRAMAMSRNRMMAAISDADVVLVNPTHLAVALVYAPESGAPRCVAKGAGAVAAKIREKADDARVPIVRDVPLTRALYPAVEVGQFIPVELYQAVARILAFVYGLKRKGQGSGTHDSPFVDRHELPAVPRQRRRRPATAQAAA